MSVFSAFCNSLALDIGILYCLLMRLKWICQSSRNFKDRLIKTGNIFQILWYFLISLFTRKICKQYLFYSQFWNLICIWLVRICQVRYIRSKVNLSLTKCMTLRKIYIKWNFVQWVKEKFAANRLPYFVCLSCGSNKSPIWLYQFFRFLQIFFLWQNSWKFYALFSGIYS